MKQRNDIKYSYDPDADVLMLRKKGTGKIDHAEEMGDFVVHFSKQNVPLLIEILNASSVIAESNKNMLQMARKKINA